MHFPRSEEKHHACYEGRSPLPQNLLRSLSISVRAISHRSGLPVTPRCSASRNCSSAMARSILRWSSVQGRSCTGSVSFLLADAMMKRSKTVCIKRASIQRGDGRYLLRLLRRGDAEDVREEVAVRAGRPRLKPRWGEQSSRLERPMRPEDVDAAERSPSHIVSVIAFLALSIRRALAMTFSDAARWCSPVRLPERRHPQR